MLARPWISSGQAVNWEMWNLRNGTTNPHSNPIPIEEIPKPREPTMETILVLMFRSAAGVVVCVCVCAHVAVDCLSGPGRPAYLGEGVLEEKETRF